MEGSEYPTLDLTRRGQEVVKGLRSVEVKTAVHSRLRRPIRTPVNGPNNSMAASLTSSVDPQLFERLRQLRKELPRKRGVAPFVIFHDKTLRTIAGHKPCDAERPAGDPRHRRGQGGAVWPARARDRQRRVPVTFPCVSSVVSIHCRSIKLFSPSRLYGIVSAIPHMSSSQEIAGILFLADEPADERRIRHGPPCMAVSL